MKPARFQRQHYVPRTEPDGISSTWRTPSRKAPPQQPTTTTSEAPRTGTPSRPRRSRSMPGLTLCAPVEMIRSQSRLGRLSPSLRFCARSAAPAASAISANFGCGAVSGNLAAAHGFGNYSGQPPQLASNAKTPSCKGRKAIKKQESPLRSLHLRAFALETWILT